MTAPLPKWAAAAAAMVALGAASPALGQSYSLNFSSRSNRMSWTPTLPSWSYSAPVALSAAGDSTSMLRITASASMRATLNQRRDGDTWQESASVRTAVNYPILGPKASIGVNASMSSRNATLVKQKIRSQSYNFRFQYRPLAEGDGPFRSLRIDLTPGVITSRRASAANLDSTIAEQGLQYSASLNVSPDMELAGRKVTCNAIAPGFIETDMTGELGEEVRAAIAGKIPLGDLGAVDDVAAVALFLASRDARYITGQVLAVDGGMTM